MMKCLWTCLFVLGSMTPGTLRAEFRIWTNTEGVNVDAELAKIDGDNVTFRLRSGALTTFAKSKLSEADREFLARNPTITPAAPATPAAKPVAAGTPPTPAAVDANRKAKWQSKMAKAQEEAKTTGLPILVLFTGTSWCSYCIKLEAEVFSKKEFTAFANKSLVLLKLEYGPGGSPPNKEGKKLQEEFGVKGFPTYFLLDAAGSKLAQGGYHGGINPDAFATWVKGATAKGK